MASSYAPTNRSSSRSMRLTWSTLRDRWRQPVDVLEESDYWRVRANRHTDMPGGGWNDYDHIARVFAARAVARVQDVQLADERLNSPAERPDPGHHRKVALVPTRWRAFVTWCNRRLGR